MNSQTTAPNPSLWHRLRRNFRDSFSEGFSYGRRAPAAERLNELLAKRRRDAYRYVLLLLALILVPVITYNLYSEQTLLPGVAGLLLLAILIANIGLLSSGREAFLTPPLVLLLSICLVVLSVYYGPNYNLFWLYPLLAALPVLLQTRLALSLGGVCSLVVVPMVYELYDIGAATVLVFSMGLTWLVSAWLVYAVTEQSRHLREMSITDPMTGAYNRRYLEMRIEEALENWRRYERPSSILMIDIDHFKRINDTFGHATGDQAIRHVVELFSKRIRNVDILCRYGGEEFVILLGETFATSAVKLADDLRLLVAEADILTDGRVTVSVGVCDVTAVDDLDQWLNLADAALYLAKRNGRNRVDLATSLDVLPESTETSIEKSVPDWR